MTDVDSMVMSLRLAWLKRPFGSNDGGFFFFNRNYDIRDHPNLLHFYSELLQWWSEFRQMSASEKDWVHVIWNNKDIRIKSLFFYKNHYDSGIIYIFDLPMHKSVKDSTNFLV